MNGPSQRSFREHEVLFLDFLGFANAVQSWDDERMEKALDLLVSLAESQSAFNIQGEALSDGGYRITGVPEITTFSDHIVISYPLVVKPNDFPDEAWRVISNGWDGMVRQQMQKIAALVTMRALDIGLLVRGGLSRGKLYHTGRVVVGESMVDAHRLESTVAHTARVIVSTRIEDDDRLFIDDDGARCLEYLSEMMLAAEEQYGNARSWVDQKIVDIDATIRALTANGLAKEAGKWSYFKGKLSGIRDTWP